MDIRKAEALALQLMKLHGLRDWNNLEKFWSFKWDHARKRFGQCRYKTRTISLSKPLTLLNSEEQVTDTIKHEIAHALAGIQSKAWPVMARAVSGNRRAAYGLLFSARRSPASRLDGWHMPGVWTHAPSVSTAQKTVCVRVMLQQTRVRTFRRAF